MSNSSVYNQLTRDNYKKKTVTSHFTYEGLKVTKHGAMVGVLAIVPFDRLLPATPE